MDSFPWKMFFMNDVTLLIVLGFGLLIIITGSICALKRFEVAIFLVALSPWLSALFIPNTPNEGQEEGVGSYLRISLLLWMGMIGVIRYFRSRDKEGKQLPLPFFGLGAFLALSLLSAGYSIDPFYTFIRSCSFIALFGFLLGLYSWLQDIERFEAALNTLFLLVSFFILCSAFSLVAVPDRVWWWEDSNRFQGLWSHPNTLGSVCMVSYPILFWKYGRSSTAEKTMVIGLIILAGGMHFLTGSRASLFSTFLGLGLWFLFRNKKLSFFLFLGMITLLTALLFKFRPESFQREEGTTLTGLTRREEFWHGSYTLIKEKPLWGFGYGVEGKIWEDSRFYEKEEPLWSGTVKASLHNGYLSIAIGLGIIGFLTWCLIVIVPLCQSLSLPMSDIKSLALAMMFMSLLLNFFESVIVGTSSLTAILFWITWIFTGRLIQNHRMGDLEYRQGIEKFCIAL
jgi:O-antigen ligase